MFVSSGRAGLEAIGDGGTAVVVDVLRFTTAVEAATSRGAIVYPYRWHDESATHFARTVGAQLAQSAAPDGPSLSPLSLLRLRAGDAIVLPSPNGSTCAALAAEAGATVVAGCLRNAAAVADWSRRQAAPVVVVACGERWPDGSLRPALEDLLGAGAVLAGIGGRQSPEAAAAVAAWRDAQDHLGRALLECSSGQELSGKGRSDDVGYAAQPDVSTIVPVLRDGAFRAVP